MNILRNKNVITVILVTLFLIMIPFDVFALPTAFISEGVEDAAGTNDAAVMFTGTQLWIGNQMDLTTMAADGKVGISSKSDNATKDYVIDGNKSIFAINYVKNNMTGDPYKEWCNIWSTHDTNFGLKNSSTYIVSFIMRTYTEWNPDGTGKLQNFAIVSVRNYRYKGGAGLVDYFIQPNIQSPEVTPDQMIRIADFSVPANPKNTMSIKKLNDNTFSIVCKFVTDVPTEDIAVGNDKWFATFTFHGPGVIACDNIKVYKSDLVLSSFHQKLPAGSTSSTASSTVQSIASSIASELDSSIDSSAVASEDVSSLDESSLESVEISSATSSAADISSEAESASKSNANSADPDGGNGAVIGIIIAAVVIAAGAGAALYFFVLKKKA